MLTPVRIYQDKISRVVRMCQASWVGFCSKIARKYPFSFLGKLLPRNLQGGLKPPVLAYCSKETFCQVGCWLSANLSSVAFSCFKPSLSRFFEMRHKRQKDLAPGEPASKHFRRNVADLVLSNQISAERAEELRRDALASGSTGVRDLIKGADGQYALGRGRNPNAARDLKRRFLKKTWFPEYLANIPNLES